MKVTGKNNVPEEGGVIIVSNHVSHLDPPLIGITCDRKVHFLAKTELFRGLIGWFMVSTGQIRVERGKAVGVVDIAVESLKKGFCLCIFPEGTRSRTGEMRKPHTGVVVIASKASCPIVPVFIEGTFQAMPPKTKFPRLFKKVRITYGEPFYLSNSEMDIENKENMRRTADGIMERIKALGNSQNR